MHSECHTVCKADRSTASFIVVMRRYNIDCVYAIPARWAQDSSTIGLRTHLIERTIGNLTSPGEVEPVLIGAKCMSLNHREMHGLESE